jgi:hypothetical protein
MTIIISKGDFDARIKNTEGGKFAILFNEKKD